MSDRPAGNPSPGRPNETLTQARGDHVAREDPLASVRRQLADLEYAISHDLRAPLRSLDGFSKILLRDHAERLDEEGQDFLHRIRRAAERLREMIEAILSLSRMRTLPLDAEPVDPTAVFHEALRTHASLDPEQRVDVALSPMVPVCTSRRLFAMIAEQLTSNALKAVAASPSPRISIGSTNGPDRTRQTFFVEDNGIGLDPERASDAISLFRSLHPDVEFPGTGVGLAIVDRAVALLGGQLVVSTPASGGTRMSFDVEHQEI